MRLTRITLQWALLVVLALGGWPSARAHATDRLADARLQDAARHFLHLADIDGRFRSPELSRPTAFRRDGTSSSSRTLRHDISLPRVTGLTHELRPVASIAALRTVTPCSLALVTSHERAPPASLLS